MEIGKYIGGFFGYIITKQGAKKLDEFIQKNGIKHGIDYLIKLIPGFVASNVQPHIVVTEWVSSFTSPVDTDIQKDYTSLPLSVKVNKDDWIFYEGQDSGGSDIQSLGDRTVDELFSIAEANPNCVAFNTLGFLKSKVGYSLISSPWLSAPHGIYIRKSYKRLLRVKMICNWCSSKDLCDEWLKLSMGNYIWNDIQITWEDNDIDYYVIINKPKPGDIYKPEKTIIFHMEPWCGEAWQTWGVKTWGEWAKPDPAKFLQVRSHDKFCNTGFWQINMTYTELKEKQIIKSESMGNTISSICSSKYFDPGHKKRIDFMKFIESKNDESVKLHIYNEDNQHGFASYAGKARPSVDKEKGIIPYKYYFMCENNAEKNFITEKLWEPILCESLCFYWGCPNVTDHVDPLAYVQLDMNDFERSFQIVKSAIECNLWEQRLPAIKVAKQRILDEYGFFPLLESALKKKDYPEPLVTGVSKVCFIHSCTLASSGTEKLDLLLNSMKSSGLLEELDSVVINNIGLPLTSKKYTLDSRIQVLQHSSDSQLFELPTLKLIHEYSQKNPNVKILYLHTKGISYDTSNYKYVTGLDWINYMLYFLVGASQYSNCLRLLDTHDTVGCNFSQKPHPHYSGNFWWATTNYLKTLSVDSLTSKMSAEWWVLSGESNKCVLHSTNKNHFSERCALEEYCKKSLVVYTYFASPSSDYNLDFYSKHAITESTSVDYIIVINCNGPHTCAIPLPTLRNLKVIYRDNIGFDFGGHKAALDSLGDKKYDYYFFMNSGVIGPFLSDTHPSNCHWTDLFIRKITDKVKLVGTSIFCECEALEGSGPRVETFCFMTDHIGLSVLLKQGTVFYNNETKYDVVKNGELGMTQCILKNGYTVDCMLKRYQGVDWLDKANWSMNNNRYPSRKNDYFGGSINPYEVIFHKWYWANPKDSDVSIEIVHDYVSKKSKPTSVFTKLQMGPFTEFELVLRSIPELQGVRYSYTKYDGSPIIFQTEQMCYNGSHRNTDILLDSIPANTNVIVCDYSLRNIQYIKDAINSDRKYSGIRFIHVPLIYTPSTLLSFKLYDTKENDIACIFGCASERRMAIVNQLQEKGLKVFVINNWDIQGKIYEISKCRLLLNIHYSENHSIFEYARCTIPLLLGIPVLSETSDITLDSKNTYLNELVSSVHFEPYDTLVTKAIEMLQSYHSIRPINLARLKELSEAEYRSVNTQISKGLFNIQNADKNVCFIHSCTMPNSGTEILDSLLEAIKTSGILTILDSIVINNVGLSLGDKYASFHPNMKVYECSSDPSVFELPTLKLLHQYSLENPNVNVLYLHTKGVSYTKESYIYSKNTDWVNYMLYFLVHRYTKCITMLETHDTVGCDYSTLFNKPHYAGNFWWATTNYLQTLSTSVLNEKHDAEWWLLGNTIVNKYVLHISIKMWL